MRAQTPSYVVSVKLHLPKQIENHLEKSFHVSNSVYEIDVARFIDLYLRNDANSKENWSIA